MEKNIYGLSMQEVEEKRRKGEGEHEPESITKSKKQIIRENVLTLFNLLNFIIAGLLFAVGAYTNMIFIAIIIRNIVIGIAQESVHINRLREKLEDDPREPKIIETVWGVGYRMNR